MRLQASRRSRGELIMRMGRTRQTGWLWLLAVFTGFWAVSFGILWLFTITGWVESHPSAPHQARMIAWVLVLAVALLCYALSTRAERRVRAGHCPNCNYDRRGDFSAGCPECGWRREDVS